MANNLSRLICAVLCITVPMVSQASEAKADVLINAPLVTVKTQMIKGFRESGWLTTTNTEEATHFAKPCGEQDACGEGQGFVLVLNWDEEKKKTRVSLTEFSLVSQLPSGQRITETLLTNPEVFSQQVEALLTWKTILDSEYAGIGVQGDFINGLFTIASVIPGGPAAVQSDLSADEIIVSVAQGKKGRFKSIVGKSLADLVEVLRGKIGSTVKLRVASSVFKINETREVVLTRELVRRGNPFSATKPVESIRQDQQVSAGNVIGQQINTGGSKNKMLPEPKVVIDSSDPNAFIINQVPESLQSYGFNFICGSLGPVTSYKSCGPNSYSLFVNKKGTLLNETPYRYSSYLYFDVIFEDGTKKQIQVYDPDSDSLFESRNLMRLSSYEEMQSEIGKSLVDGSDVKVSKINTIYGGHYILSSGHEIAKRDFKAIKGLSNYLVDRSLIADFLTSTSDMRIEYDKFERFYRVSAKPYVFKSLDYRPSISLRMQISRSGVTLKQKIQYADDDWLFVDRYKIVAGDEFYESSTADFSRDHSGGSVWEWRSVAFDERQKQVVEAILDDPEATIRFYGSDYYHDHVVTQVEKRELKRVLELSKMLDQST